MSQRRVLILGAHGQLGRELAESFTARGEVLALDRARADFTQPELLRTAIRAARPDIILNAAAYTAVDRAQSQPEIARAVNAAAPRVLAEEAARCGALLVHYSTDYVFDGAKAGPWVETDPPRPLNVYGATKLEGEQAIRETGGRFLIFRTSWVYGPRGSNFLLTMLRLGKERELLKVVDDQTGAPTAAYALARATRTVVDQLLAPGAAEGASGIYHMSCGGSVSWCGFARAIFARAGERAGLRVKKVEPIPSREYPTPAERPRNSVLSNAKLESRFGVRLPAWETALDQVIAALPGL